MQSINDKFIVPFLIASIVLIGLAACSTNSNREIVFRAEKKYHQTIKAMQTLSLKPDLAETSDMIKIKERLKDLVDYCNKNIPLIPPDSFPEEYGDLQSVAYRTSVQLANLYFNNRQYDSAGYTIRQFLTVFNPQDKTLLNSRLYLARALQAGGRLEEALAVDNSLIDTFYPPIDNENNIITEVLNLPLEAVAAYTLVNDQTTAAEATVNAEKYYQKLIADWPNSALEAAANSNLARLYVERGQWNNAIEVLSRLKDTTGQIDLEAAIMIARVKLDGLKNYSAARDDFEQLLKRTDDTTIIPLILMYQGTAFYEQGRYQDCLRIMSQIDDEYSSFYRNNPKPQQYVAQSYAGMGQWTRAENEYRWLIDNYLISEEAFDAYLVIAAHYDDNNESAMAESWYQRAEEFYKQMAARYQGNTIEASAISYLAEIARRTRNWPAAATYLERIFIKFPETDIGRRSLMTAAGIYRGRMNRPEKADSLLNLLKGELMPPDDSKNISVMTDDNK